MNRRQKVELFEQIRREYEFGVGTVAGVARQLGVHRRLVRQALQSAWPSERRCPVRSRPRLAPVQPFIDAMLEQDRQGVPPAVLRKYTVAYCTPSHQIDSIMDDPNRVAFHRELCLYCTPS